MMFPSKNSSNISAGAPSGDINADIIMFVSRTTLTFSVFMYLSLNPGWRQFFCPASYAPEFFNQRVSIKLLHDNCLLVKSADCEDSVGRSSNLLPYFLWYYYLPSF